MRELHSPHPKRSELMLIVLVPLLVAWHRQNWKDSTWLHRNTVNLFHDYPYCFRVFFLFVFLGKSWSDISLGRSWADGLRRQKPAWPEHSDFGWWRIELCWWQFHKILPDVASMIWRRVRSCQFCLTRAAVLLQKSQGFRGHDAEIEVKHVWNI